MLSEMDDPYAPPATREVELPPRKHWVGEAVLRSVGAMVVLFQLIEPVYEVGFARMRQEGLTDDFLGMVVMAGAGLYGFGRGGRRWQLGIAIVIVLSVLGQVLGRLEQSSQVRLPGGAVFPGWEEMVWWLVPEVVMLVCAVALWWRGRKKPQGRPSAAPSATKRRVRRGY